MSASVKRRLTKIFVMAGAIIMLTAGYGHNPALSDDTAARLRAAISHPQRVPKNAARDKYRHPFETLQFFGIKPGMTVVEIWPGRGWYTEILAPFLKEKGRLYAASWDADLKSAFVQRTLKSYRARFVEQPGTYGRIALTELSRKKTKIAPPGTADMVLTFRSVHNWMKRGYERTIFEAMFSALKPGGVLGVVEHRGDPDIWQDPQALSGYVNEEHVIELATDVGFKLVAKSEVNANPKDRRVHAKGVWTLPPTLRLKNTDRDKYLAIGESDRMTLKFVKPK